MILSHNMGNHTFSLEAIRAKDEMRLNSNMNKTKDPIANGKINSKVSFTTIGARWNYSGENFDSMTLLSQMYTKNNLQLFDAEFFVDTKSSAEMLYHETTFELEGHKPLIGVELFNSTTPVKAYITSPPSSDDFEPLISDQEVVNLDKTFKAQSYSLFVQDIWDIGSKDHFRYGLRGWSTNFQEFGRGIDPRVAYVHDFSGSLSLSFALGRYSQMPEITYAIDGFGNPLLDTLEHSNHYTFNMTKIFDKESSLVIEPYFKTFENLAISDEVNRYESVGKGEAYGVDITYRKKIDRFDLIVAYTFVKAKRQLNTNSKKQYRFEGDIPHTLQVNTAYTFANNWRLSSLFKFSSGKPYTPVIGIERADYHGKGYNRPLYGKPYSRRMPNNFDLDIQIGKTFHYADNKSLEYTIELMNLNALFKKNIESYRYDDEYHRDGEYDQMGFLPAFHLTYRF